ncbi:MAG: LacI family transcriptional regulator [Bifidobacterium sp.]|nr:LacI family DNA-binding transcriptional regulator [Bifidobacterium sp.]MCH4208873.1 LacI family transcriptional regulator [Bifidobacterium sp.]
MRRATVYDVAEQAGVSTATVSFTFHHPDKVKPATREKVLRAAEGLNYVPSANARGLARGRTGVFGLYSFDMLIERPLGDEDDAVISDVGQADADNHDGPDVLAYPLYVDEVQRGFELECWHRGRNVLLGSASAANDGAGITDIAGRVDGLAVFPGQFADDPSLSSLCRSIPIVRLSEGRAGDPAAYIACDNVSGMNQLIDHLVDVHGLWNIAFIGKNDNYDMRSRFAAMQGRLRYRGLPVPQQPLDESDAICEEHFVALCRAIDEGRLPQALVCTNDQTAFDVIQVLHDAGVDVPRNIVVTGFDGVLAGGLLSPGLTTVRQPMEAMGRMAARLLDERSGRPWENPVNFVFPVRMVVRGSCGCQ